MVSKGWAADWPRIRHSWDLATLEANLARRNPDLTVVGYGTNEAGSRLWTLDSYRAAFTELLARFRSAVPAASILVIGPPDRDQRVRRNWRTLERVGMIAEAQRQAAVEMGCAFLDLRGAMGGAGSMSQWVKVGWAQKDHVHLTGPGYRMLARAVCQELMRNYSVFLSLRPQIMAGPVLPSL